MVREHGLTLANYCGEQGTVDERYCLDVIHLTWSKKVFQSKLRTQVGFRSANKATSPILSKR